MLNLLTFLPYVLSRRARMGARHVWTSIAGLLLCANAAPADWHPALTPLLAQETTVEGSGYPVLDWLIVVVLIGAALFVVCRTSRRN